MGAHDEIYTYRNKSKQEVRQAWTVAQEDARAMYGFDPYSGTIATMPGPPRFIDRVFDDENAAHEFILDNHDKREAAIAVSFKLEDGSFAWAVGGWAAE